MDDSRLHRYERRTQVPLALLALAFLGAYAWPILDPGLSPTVVRALGWAGTGLWLIFVADYAVRLGLARRRLEFVRRHWFDLPLLLLPMLRPLKFLRGVTALRFIGRAGTTFARGRVVAMISAMMAGGTAVAALALLDAERSNPDANIQDYGDALWWAMSTITTVGYGDRYPTTVEGRLVAGSLMIAGIALLGVVTASLASWFVERIGEVARAERGVEKKLEVLINEVTALRERVEELSRGR